MRTVNFSQGSHEPNGLWLPKVISSYSQQFSFEFSEDCLYIPADWENDTNKLCGFTLGLLPRKVTKSATYPDGDSHGYLFPVHYNSARLVWRPEFITGLQDGKPIRHQTGLIELFGYVYEQGVRSMWRIGSCNVNQRYYGYNKVDNTHHMLSIAEVGATTRTHDFGKLCPFGWRTNPYMGGNAPAVQDISLQLSR